MRTHDVIWINVVQFFDIFLDNFQVWRIYGFLVVIIISLLSKWMKLAETLDFMSFKSLLMLNIYIFAWDTVVLELILLIGMITYFLEGSLVIILSFSLFFTLLLYMILLISIILPESNFRNKSLILRIFSMLPLVVWEND